MHVILEEDSRTATTSLPIARTSKPSARSSPATRPSRPRRSRASRRRRSATAREYATERHAAIFYTLEITEHACGVDNIWSLANLVLMTGHLGYESTGLNALRGEQVVQGLNDSGANPHYFPGYQPWDDSEVRASSPRLGRRPARARRLPPRPDDEQPPRRPDQETLYLVGENPAQTEPNLHHVEEGLQQLEFLVAQDLFLNETSRRRTKRRPPASSFAEKDGAFTNTERRINRVRAAVPLPGNARGDHEIVIALARALGCDWPVSGR